MPFKKRYIRIRPNSMPWGMLVLMYNVVRTILSIAFVRDPDKEKLLPDPLNTQPKYTLVLEMTGILVHPEWTILTGSRYKKRPNIDFFLQEICCPNFEVVIYTQESGLTGHPLLESLDPNHAIMYRLYKETTLEHDGHHIKNLSRLNRDLSKVILVDWDPEAFSLQPENALRVPKWEGDDSDSGLLQLGDILIGILHSNVEDVRPTIKEYSRNLVGNKDRRLPKDWPMNCAGEVFVTQATV